jgi:hypothetical protein
VFQLFLSPQFAEVKMKKLIGISAFIFVSFVFLFVCSAEIAFFGPDSKQVSAEEYQKIAQGWQMNMSEIYESRQNAAPSGDDAADSLEEGGSQLADPITVRQKRLNQWKKYREIHSG